MAVVSLDVSPRLMTCLSTLIEPRLITPWFCLEWSDSSRLHLMRPYTHKYYFSMGVALSSVPQNRIFNTISSLKSWGSLKCQENECRNTHGIRSCQPITASTMVYVPPLKALDSAGTSGGDRYQLTPDNMKCLHFSSYNSTSIKYFWSLGPSNNWVYDDRGSRITYSSVCCRWSELCHDFDFCRMAILFSALLLGSLSCFSLTGEQTAWRSIKGTAQSIEYLSKEPAGDIIRTSDDWLKLSMFWLSFKVWTLNNFSTPHLHLFRTLLRATRLFDVFYVSLSSMFVTHWARRLVLGNLAFGRKAIFKLTQN
jgi:hypothetical protein